MRRTLHRALSVLLSCGLAVAILGALPADAVGSGDPVILSPVEEVVAGDATDFDVDFRAAPYGTYAWAVVESGSGDPVVSGTFTFDASDPEIVTLTTFSVGLGEYVASLSDDVSGATASSTFGAISLGEPPTACAIVLPTKVVVTGPATKVWPRFPDCAGQSATWNVLSSSGQVYGAFRIIDGVSQGAWTFRDSYPAGVYRVVGETQQDSAQITVKFGSRLSVAAGPRQGTKFKLSGIASRYSSSAHAYRRWPNRPIAISYKDCLACPWTFLAMDRTNRYGGFDLTVISGEARYYRARVGETWTAWGRTSKPVRR